MNQPVQESPQLTVLYDGACPLCRREISVYRGLRPLHPNSPVCFADVSDTRLALPPDSTRNNCWPAFTYADRTASCSAGRRPFWRHGPRCPAGG